MKAQALVCIFHKQGYCSKGKYCEFSHDASNNASTKTPCRFFAANGKCQFGNQCSFMHDKPATAIARPAIPSRPPIQKPTTVPPAATSYPSKASSTAIEYNNDALWGFDGHDHSQSYAAHVAVSNEEIALPKSFNALQKGTEDESSTLGSNITKAPICQYFICGTCRYGDFCRYSHDLGIADTSTADQLSETSASSGISALEAGTAALSLLPISPLSSSSSSQLSPDAAAAAAAYQPAECGICLASPTEGKLYGLLSHCDCVFCLECIRGWRKDGIDVAKSSSQVRLCPLCRTQSYFVCPVPRHLKGPHKQLAIDAYKASMGKIVCRNYQQGNCDFGSSCFYKHVNPDGSIGTTTKPRTLLNSATEVELRGSANTVSLFEFVAPVLSRRSGR